MTDYVVGVFVIAQTPLAASTFIFLYTLTPLPTTALFTAAGMARVNPWHILPPFFCGRLITDGVMVYTGKYAAGNVSGLLHGQLSIKSVLTLIAAFSSFAPFFSSTGAVFFKSESCASISRFFAKHTNFPVLPGLHKSYDFRQRLGHSVIRAREVGVSRSWPSIAARAGGVGLQKLRIDGTDLI